MKNILFLFLSLILFTITGFSQNNKGKDTTQLQPNLLIELSGFYYPPSNNGGMQPYSSEGVTNLLVSKNIYKSFYVGLDYQNIIRNSDSLQDNAVFNSFGVHLTSYNHIRSSRFWWFVEAGASLGNKNEFSAFANGDSSKTLYFTTKSNSPILYIPVGVGINYKVWKNISFSMSFSNRIRPDKFGYGGSLYIRTGIKYKIW